MEFRLFIEGPNDKSFIFWDVGNFKNDLPINHPYSKYDSMGYLENKNLGNLFRAEKTATEIALTEARRPNVTVRIDSIGEEGLGNLIMFSQYFTAYAGEFYDINAFDQPGVEYGKKLTFAMMGRSGFADYGHKIEEMKKRGRSVI